jgi:hypothetical protein
VKGTLASKLKQMGLPKTFDQHHVREITLQRLFQIVAGFPSEYACL